MDLLPKQLIIMYISTNDHIQEKTLKSKEVGLVLIKLCYMKRSRTMAAVCRHLVQTEDDSCSPEKIREILVKELYAGLLLL